MPAASTSVKRTPFALVGLGTVGASVAANALCYYLAGTLVSYDQEFLPLASVGGAIIMTLAPAIIAVLLYAALRHFTRHAVPIFTTLSAVVFGVSLIPVFTYIPTVPGSTGAQTAILIVMHVVAAVVIVGMLTAPDRARPR
jgi:hypothetical protein